MTTDDPVPPCCKCKQSRSPAEALIYGGKCEDCWVESLPTKVGATSGAHVSLQSEDVKGGSRGPRLWMW